MTPMVTWKNVNADVYSLILVGAYQYVIYQKVHMEGIKSASIYTVEPTL